MLAHIYWPDFPVPVGVIRRIDRPTHDQLLNDQVAQAIAARGRGDLARLLAAGDTWTVG
jgi:2-oxoglutarate ferredoxin oxidoreductase subunit beta